MQSRQPQLRLPEQKALVVAEKSGYCIEMGLADDIAEIDCPHCRRLAIEDLAKSVVNPKNLALLSPEDASEMREYLATLLNRPDDSLEQLARVLATKVKAGVGIFQN